MNNMQVWTICVFVVFGIVELYQWFQALTLPLPVYGIAGLILAFASNANQWTALLDAKTQRSLGSVPPESLTSDPQAEASSEIDPLKIDQDELHHPGALSSAHPKPAPQLPNLTSLNPPPLSFTISKPQ